MSAIDSSAWICYLKNEVNASYFAQPISDTNDLILPSIVIHEVYKFLCRHDGKKVALESIISMQQAQVSVLDEQLAIDAANIGLEHKLPLADSIIYATTLRHNATLWTQDNDFENLPHVNYFMK